MSDITGITSLDADSDGTESLAGIQEAVTNLNTDKAEDADLDTHTSATAAHGATGAVVGTTNTQTLTNKTLTSPTITNKSSTGTDSGAETLANKTLTTPTIGSFANATHDHEDSAGGGQLDATNVFGSGTVPTARLGSGTASSSTYLRGDQSWASVAGIQRKIIRTSRAQASGSGTQTISGVGFTPVLILVSAIALNDNTDTAMSFSNGSYDGTTQGCVGMGWDNANPANPAPFSETNLVRVYKAQNSANNNWAGVGTNIGSDGFDITWSMTGSPGTVELIITFIG